MLDIQSPGGVESTIQQFAQQFTSAVTFLLATIDSTVIDLSRVAYVTLLILRAASLLHPPGEKAGEGPDQRRRRPGDPLGVRLPVISRSSERVAQQSDHTPEGGDLLSKLQEESARYTEPPFCSTC